MKAESYRVDAGVAHWSEMSAAGCSVLLLLVTS